MEVHQEQVNSIEVDISQRRIVTASSDGIVRIFYTKGQENPDELILESELLANSGPVTKAVFLNNGEMVVSAYFSGKIILWKQEGTQYNKKFEHKVLEGSIVSIAGHFSQACIKIFCACSDGFVRTVVIDNNFSSTTTEMFCHRYGVSTISLSGDLLATGGVDYSCALWEGETELVRFRDHKSFVRDVSIAPPNSFNLVCLASCSDDGTVIIYTKRNEKYESQIIEIGEPCYSLSWSVSGFSLSVGYGDSSFKCFVPYASGKFKEVPLKKIEKK